MILYHIDNYEVTKKNAWQIGTQFFMPRHLKGLRIKGVVWRELKQKKSNTKLVFTSITSENGILFFRISFFQQFRRTSRNSWLNGPE